MGERPRLPAELDVANGCGGWFCWYEAAAVDGRPCCCEGDEAVAYGCAPPEIELMLPPVEPDLRCVYCELPAAAAAVTAAGRGLRSELKSPG